jgi:hypothetical protein
MTNPVDVNQLSLVAVNIIGGRIEPSIDFTPDSKQHHYNFNFDTQSNIAPDKKLIRFIIKVDIREIINSTIIEAIIASFTTEFIFHINNMEDVVQFADDAPAVVQYDMAVTLASVSYSTMRGIVLSRTQGTYLNGIILPIVDPAKLLDFTQVMPEMISQ